MNDFSNICLSCGLCCDGTLIGFVELGSKELPALKKVMDVEESNGAGFFLHPCKKYCDGCTIYSDRPKQCASFNCGLLKSVEQKELNFDSAIELIAEVKQRRNILEKKITHTQHKLKSHSFYFKMVELNNLLKGLPAERLKQNDLALISDLKLLDNLLIKRFGISLY